MNSQVRREKIKEVLCKNSDAYKGQKLAEIFGVTRQIIVKDIAILRAEGINIIATPEGYIVPKNDTMKIKKVIATLHNKEDIEDEMKIIIRYGGVIEDVIVEHPLYGEIKGMLMVKSLYDIENFIDNLCKYEAEPLSLLTNGIHLHTISAESEEVMDNIICELKNKGFLVDNL
ncbi:MAG: transcription repressor NadR [Clostridium argentinense]|uniref:transcription repressor NadR n=1 Tax=Clostridium butanoliproducens TaxID=2991837 RepID=UPI001DD34E4E|nr:transcription repressor NadR [Clostridium butanoliproducens]MBS5825022.1 transcription repressor NadR [Clostridium argentinense]MDU1350896.1 transcription repressor NadR [Clostridium argentinense]